MDVYIRDRAFPVTRLPAPLAYTTFFIIKFDVSITGFAEIFGTSLAAVLTDKLGRRTLMWIGYFTSSFSCAMIGISQSCAGGVWACQGS